MDKVDTEMVGSIVTAWYPSKVNEDDDYQVKIEASGITDKHANFKTELDISVRVPSAKDGQYRWERVEHSGQNLLASTLKTTFRKHMEERTEIYGVEFYWGNILQSCADGIIRAYREGEPAFTVGKLTNFVPRDYAVKPFLFRGVPNLIWAQGGSGKSWFGLLFCVLIDKGLEAHGIKAKQGKALYLDWEEEPDLFVQRVKALHKGLGINSDEESGIVYKKMSGSLAANIENIAKIVQRDEISFLVVDSVNASLSGSMNDDETIREYFNSLNGLAITTLSIDHANKAGETTGKWQLGGSASKKQRARQVFELRRFREPGVNSLDVVWYHEKGNDSRLGNPKAWQLNFHNTDYYNEQDNENQTVLDMVTFESIDIGDPDNPNFQTLSTQEMVYQLVFKRGAMSAETIAMEIGTIKDETFNVTYIEKIARDSQRLELTSDGIIKLQGSETQQWNL